MSRLYFHTEHDGTAELMGWEAHWIRAIPEEVAIGFVPREHRTLEPHLAPDSYLRPLLGTPALAANLPAAIAHGDEHIVDVTTGRALKGFQLVLNTALVVGSDVVAFATRLAAQCEIHCYLEGEHREWAAGLIEQGRATGLYRSGAGWEDVAKLLRVRDDQPVVCSYSVTDSFPNAHVARWEPPTGEDGEPDWDAWYDVPHDEQWAMGLAGLRGEPERGLELSPEQLRYPFGHERSFIDLFVTPPASR